MTTNKFVSDNFKMESLETGNHLTEMVIKYKDKPLFLIKTRVKFNQMVYIKEENGQEVHEMMKSFNHDYLDLFLEDVAEQLMIGTDRNNLKLNIPKEIKQIKIGEKTRLRYV